MGGTGEVEVGGWGVMRGVPEPAEVEVVHKVHAHHWGHTHVPGARRNSTDESPSTSKLMPPDQAYPGVRTHTQVCGSELEGHWNTSWSPGKRVRGARGVVMGSLHPRRVTSPAQRQQQQQQQDTGGRNRAGA